MSFVSVDLVQCIVYNPVKNETSRHKFHPPPDLFHVINRLTGELAGQVAHDTFVEYVKVDVTFAGPRFLFQEEQTYVMDSGPVCRTESSRTFDARKRD